MAAMAVVDITAAMAAGIVARSTAADIAVATPRFTVAPEAIVATEGSTRHRIAITADFITADFAFQLDTRA